MFIVFDIAVIALILFGIGLVAFESYGYALLSMIVLSVGSWVIFEPFRNFVLTVGWHNLLLKWIPLYLAAGVLVALIKWFFHVWKTASSISDAKETFKEKDVSESTNPVVRRQAFVEHFMNACSSHGPDYINTGSVTAKRWQEEGIVAELLTPRAKKHLDRISFWVLEWPYVVIATIFDDILIKFARNVGRFFDWAFTNMSRFWIARVVKGI